MVNFRDTPDLGPEPGEHPQVVLHPDAEEASAVVHLNADFLAEQGEVAATNLSRTVNAIAATYGERPLDEIRTALAERLTQVGVRLSEVEVDRYADRIARGEHITITGP